MRLGQLAYIFVLLVLAAPAAATAKDTGSRTFQLTLTLSGTYHEEVHYTAENTQSFCPGTGHVADAPFSLVTTTAMNVRLGSKKPVHVALKAVDLAGAQWTEEVAGIAFGDDCDQIRNFKCEGPVDQGPEAGENFAYATSVGHKSAIGAELGGPPTAEPTDCGTDGYYPGEDAAGLSGATAPYTAAAFVMKTKTLEKLTRTLR